MPTGSPIDPLGMYNWNITPVGPGQVPTTPTQNVGYVAPTNFTQTNFGQFTSPNMSVSAGQGHSGLQEESVAYQGPQSSGLTYKSNIPPVPTPGLPSAGPGTGGGENIPGQAGDQRINFQGGPTSGKPFIGGIFSTGDPGDAIAARLAAGRAARQAANNSGTIAPATLGGAHIQPVLGPAFSELPGRTPNKLLSQSAMRVPDVPVTTPTLAATPSVAPKIANSIRPIISKSATWR